MSVFENTKQTLSFSMYPNPAKNTVSIEGLKAKTASVGVYDITGKQLKSLSIQHSGNINISDLSAGIYFVKITSAEGTATQRLAIE
jgi:myo-inositol-hexaphosphate 3-phosphohydrolase